MKEVLVYMVLAFFQDPAVDSEPWALNGYPPIPMPTMEVCQKTVAIHEKSGLGRGLIAKNPQHGFKLYRLECVEAESHEDMVATVKMWRAGEGT